MWPRNRSDQIVGTADVGHPIPERLVHGILECLAPGLYDAYLSAEQLHSKNIQRLTLDIFLPHENFPAETKSGGDSGRRHPMLSGASLSNNALLAHAPSEQNLTDGIVDFVCTGVTQVFTLEINLCPANLLCQPFGKIKRRFSTNIFPQVQKKLSTE